jgi:D-aminoacyl-tRNA deacylase
MIEKHRFKEQENGIYENESAMLFISKEEALRMEWLDTKFSSCYYVFLSRHRSETGIPTLTCHTTGNFSDSSEMGGRPRELGYSYPSLQKHYMRTVSSRMSRLPSYELVIEATHHGPTSLKKPVLFVEIGSTAMEWNDYNAVSFVCDAVVDTIKSMKSYGSIGIGLGGTHYPAKFTEMLIDSEHALASVASKHSLPHVDKSMIEQMVSKSVEKIRYAFMDWKGLGKDKNRLNSIVTELGLEVVRV